MFPKPALSLTVLVPVYNERYLVADSLARLRLRRGASPILRFRPDPSSLGDSSSDGTWTTSRRFDIEEQARSANRKLGFKVYEP